jgi:hypothetical protein
MLFQGTYATELYRALHRHIHADLEARQAAAAARSETERETADARLRVLGEEWRSLAAQAPERMTHRPTQLPAPGVRARPDLSRSAN